LPTHNEDGLYRNWVEDISGQIKSENNKTKSPSKKIVTKVIDGFPCKIILPSKEKDHVWIIERYSCTNDYWVPLAFRTTRKLARTFALASVFNKKMIRIRKFVPVK
jgi:hypothetical protein